jgi:hypothetical protein
MPNLEEFQKWRSRLREEIVSVRDARDQYLALFGHSAERVELLNVCARWFFGVIQRVLLRDILVGIARLTDPEKMGSHTNLVLRSLLSDPRLSDQADLREGLESAIQEATDAAEPLRPHRHKYIAHLDHAVAMGDPDSPLPDLTRDGIDGAIGKIEAAYNFHSGHLEHSDVSFSVGTVRGAEALVNALLTSKRWEIYRNQQASPDSEGGAA